MHVPCQAAVVQSFFSLPTRGLAPQPEPSPCLSTDFLYILPQPGLPSEACFCLTLPGLLPWPIAPHAGLFLEVVHLGIKGLGVSMYQSLFSQHLPATREQLSGPKSRLITDHLSFPGGPHQAASSEELSYLESKISTSRASEMTACQT